MRNSRVFAVACLAYTAAFVACAGESSSKATDTSAAAVAATPESPAPAAPQVDTTAPVPVPVPAVSEQPPTADPSGPGATEKHRLEITNYSRVAASVSFNGEWVGQWDTHQTVLLDKVAKGRNVVSVELASQPGNTLRVNVQAERGGDWVSLVSLDFNGKTGTHTIPFVAK